jgi:hypothetical protein
MMRRVQNAVCWLCVVLSGGVGTAADLALQPLVPTSLPSVVLSINGQWYLLGGCQLIQAGGQTILVVGSPGPAPVPVPTPPGPAPPDPSPAPIPPAPVPPAPVPADPFRDAIKTAYGLVGANGRQHASAVAGVYAGLAGEVEAAPAGWTVSRLVGEARIRVATDLPIDAFPDWKPFWGVLAESLTALKLEDADVARAIAAFRTVAQVLEGK